MGAHREATLKPKNEKNSVKDGGAEGDRTLDLRIAKATHQLSFNDLDIQFPASTGRIVPHRSTNGAQRNLCDLRVHIARASGLTDTALARRWRVPVRTIREARIGLTHRTHATPPDIRPRRGNGNGIGQRPQANFKWSAIRRREMT
jgi:hypothetical protein